MSKIVLYPANGYDFDAADVAAYLAGLTSGVFSSAEDFPVTAAGGLKVTVGAGRGWVHPSRFTGYSITKREADTLTMPLADPSLPRIDRIVMRYDAGARAASLQVLQGTASSTPTAPAISRTELIYDLCLAEITRPAGSTSITTGQITDTRLDEKLCGIVRDGVTGIPTDELLAAAKERINALEEKATSSAAAAKDSENAAKSSETKSAASEKNAKDSETNAQQALQDTETEHSAALQDIAQARTTALNDVADSTKTAEDAANTATEQAMLPQAVQAKRLVRLVRLRKARMPPQPLKPMLRPARKLPRNGWKKPRRRQTPTRLFLLKVPLQMLRRPEPLSKNSLRLSGKRTTPRSGSGPATTPHPRQALSAARGSASKVNLS